ncbi:hypothetical protein BDV93DRAFT_515277 [Ceratobasidium sp. AG-I]|nr:hypothetical protein BDV93DRAFT_515277 [Ceratobasidium sp. AG-I]
MCIGCAGILRTYWRLNVGIPQNFRRVFRAFLCFPLPLSLPTCGYLRVLFAVGIANFRVQNFRATCLESRSELDTSDNGPGLVTGLVKAMAGGDEGGKQSREPRVEDEEGGEGGNEDRPAGGDVGNPTHQVCNKQDSDLSEQSEDEAKAKSTAEQVDKLADNGTCSKMASRMEMVTCKELVIPGSHVTARVWLWLCMALAPKGPLLVVLPRQAAKAAHHPLLRPTGPYIATEQG